MSVDGGNTGETIKSEDIPMNNNNSSNRNVVLVDSSADVNVAAQEASSEEKNAGKHRFHTSPRTNAFNEALQLISKRLADVPSEDAGDDMDLAVRQALESLVEDIEALRDTPRAKPGDKSENYSSKIYVGVEFGTGNRAVFLSSVAPTKETHGKTYTIVCGPFASMGKADGIVKNGVGTKEKRCW